MGTTMKPCHHPRKRGHSYAYPLVHACPAPLLPITSPSPSVSPPHPPPHLIWWGRADLPVSLLKIPETPPRNSRLPLPPLLAASNTYGEPTASGAHAVTFWDPKAPGPVQVVGQLYAIIVIEMLYHIIYWIMGEILMNLRTQNILVHQNFPHNPIYNMIQHFDHNNCI